MPEYGALVVSEPPVKRTYHELGKEVPPQRLLGSFCEPKVSVTESIRGNKKFGCRERQIGPVIPRTLISCEEGKRL